MANTMIESYVKKALLATEAPMNATEVQIWLRKHGYMHGAPHREAGRNAKGYSCKIVSNQAVRATLNALVLKREIYSSPRNDMKGRVYYVK